METVEVVIKIPKKVLERIQRVANGSWGRMNLDALELAILDGISLPKGHGRLIDVDVATKDINAFQAAFAMYTDNMGKYNIVCAAPTVIEADKDGDADG